MRHEKLRFKSLFKRGSSPGNGGAIPKQPQDPQQPTGATSGGGMGGLLRRHPPLSPKSPKRLNSDYESSEKSPSAKSASFRLPRSRIGTETSVETALENVPGGSISSFEEELFRQGFQRDG